MKDIIITRTKEIDYLQFTKLLEFQDKLIHAHFLKSHNIGFNLLKDIEIRESSINKISNEFGINKNSFVQSNQTHSDNIAEFNKLEIHKAQKNIFSKNRVNEDSKNVSIEFTGEIIDNNDGYIVSEPNIATIITYADCVPIFIYDPKNNIYANIHAGWRGVVNQISIKAINKLIKDYNSNVSNLICCIGPNIRKECFLVNSDLVDIYSTTFKEIAKNMPIIEDTEYSNEKGKQYRIDNNTILKELFKKSGILEKNIIDSNICTVCDSDNFHSRRVEGPNFQKNGGLMMCN